jgi:fatty acid desaturase
MPILAQDDARDFLRRQVLTSRNVRGGWLIDFLLGGLNYQIEHHLFPSMPRASLRHARPIVRAHCLKYGLPYIEVSLFDSYRQALCHLHTVGRSGQPVGQSEAAAAPDARLIAADGRQPRQPAR